MKRIVLLLLPLMLTQPSCVVAGYSSRGGLFFWPGGIGLLLVALILFLVFRSRRR